MIGSTDLEDAVLRKLLTGEHPALQRLRRQLAGCRVARREWTGVGFFTEFRCPEASGKDFSLDTKLGDVYAEIAELRHGVGFVLYIERGVPTMLEGFTFDEPWPEAVTGFEVLYTTGAERDWAALHAILDVAPNRQA